MQAAVYGKRLTRSRAACSRCIKTKEKSDRNGRFFLLFEGRRTDQKPLCGSDVGPWMTSTSSAEAGTNSALSALTSRGWKFCGLLWR